MMISLTVYWPHTNINSMGELRIRSKNENKTPNVNVNARKAIATCQRIISQHCWAQHVACVWLKFEPWANSSQHVATHLNTVANCAQQCCDMLRWNVAIIWSWLKRNIRLHLHVTLRKLWTLTTRHGCSGLDFSSRVMLKLYTRHSFCYWCLFLLVFETDRIWGKFNIAWFTPHFSW